MLGSGMAELADAGGIIIFVGLLGVVFTTRSRWPWLALVTLGSVLLLTVTGIEVSR